MIPRSLERKYVPHHVPFESPSTQTASSSLTVSRLVGWMVDWLVWLVVIGGWRRQIILSYKITNNIIGVLRANSLVARWPGVCIVYRTSQHDRCGAPLGPFGFVFVFRKNVFRFYFYWFGFFLIVLFKKSFLGPRGDCGGMRPTGHKHSPGCGCPGVTYSCWTAALLDLLLSSQSVHPWDSRSRLCV